MSPTQLIARQTIVTDQNGNRVDRVYWWYSPTAYIIKWSIVTAIFLIFFLWFTIGYFHAKARIRKGLKPLRYHRFLAPKQGPPPQNNYGYYQAYGMPNYRYQEPPPVYNGADVPPTYQPPPGGSKVAPVQQSTAPATNLPPQETGRV